MIWVADCSDDPKHGKYVAIFWTGSGNTTIIMPVADLGFASEKPLIVRDLWRKEDLPGVTDGSLVANLGSHDVLLLRVSPS